MNDPAYQESMQLLVAALQLGATRETTAEINRGVAAVESQQRLHVGRVRRLGW